MQPQEVAKTIRSINPKVVERLNSFTCQTFQTRGGRMGSGMGLLLEGLWGYHASLLLEPCGIEIGWIVDNQYNDYAVLDRAQQWDPETKQGELLRIEAKTMNLGADESKGHFAEIIANIGANDLLLVLTWRWEAADSNGRVYPKVVDVFLDSALEVAKLRDVMHIARGGSFVSAGACPDGCAPELCTHVGEPLNARNKRERLSGPESCKPAKAQFAANFGGLFRMIAARSSEAHEILKSHTEAHIVAAEYKRFVDRNKASLTKSAK